MFTVYVYLASPLKTNTLNLLKTALHQYGIRQDGEKSLSFPPPL